MKVLRSHEPSRTGPLLSPLFENDSVASVSKPEASSPAKSSGLAGAEKVEASKPQREQFKSDEEFDEALGYWNVHAGRVLAIAKRPINPERE
jgi:hypothetical protein